MKYCIICYRHQKTGEHALLWWGKDHSGYTFNVDEAGEYTQDDVDKYFQNHRDDSPIQSDKVKALSIPMVIDLTKLGKIVINNYSNRRKLGILKKYMIKQDRCNWGYEAFIEPERFVSMHAGKQKIIDQIKEQS